MPQTHRAALDWMARPFLSPSTARCVVVHMPDWMRRANFLSSPAGSTPDMRMFREELFGPVTPVYRFSTDDGEGGQQRGWELGAGSC